MLIHLCSPIDEEWAMCDYPGDEDNGLDLTNTIDLCTCGTCLAIFNTFESMMDPTEMDIIRRVNAKLDAGFVI